MVFHLSGVREFSGFFARAARQRIFSTSSGGWPSWDFAIEIISRGGFAINVADVDANPVADASDGLDCDAYLRCPKCVFSSARLGLIPKPLKVSAIVWKWTPGFVTLVAWQPSNYDA
ncbi:hypothetical protein OZ411_14540 [Bradyrhizobium sp. Arg237L]|uniref:hypothetical protein n=1 Tax=Bradyrhizobium sp. Arg237L TaxID=3003352 RepID=UPI00249EEDF0|nr:hypothetical protein [Bradyrhizobium sp. Arg237L]MDI4234034.1 hypothetical protein [Bradyrhizobium sp. Arg237L]